MAPDTVTIRHLAAGNTKQIKTGPWLICVVSLWSGGLGAAAVAGSKGGFVGEGGGGSAGVFHLLEKIRQKVIDFPMTCPTPHNTPLHSQTAGVVSTHTTAHTNTLLQPREPYPPPRGPVTTPPHPSLGRVSLLSSASHLCLCGAAAAQRTEGAAFTSEHISHQMSPFAASPSNIQADNAPRILNI